MMGGTIRLTLGQMGSGLWSEVPTGMGTLVLSYLGCHLDELVLGNRSPQWYRLMGYSARRIHNEIEL